MLDVALDDDGRIGAGVARQRLAAGEQATNK
jgi:hypothetical protein